MAEDEQPSTPARAITRARRLELAYAAVFGLPESRTGDQKLVMADLEAHCYAHRLVSEGRSDGEVAIYRSLFNDGRRSVWLRIRGAVIKSQLVVRTPTIFRKKQKSKTQ